MLTPDQKERVVRVVDAVIDLPPDRQQAAVESICSDDLAVRDEVLRLIGNSENLADRLAGFVPPEVPNESEPSPQIPSSDPVVLGRYHIIRKLGGGGMGEVFLAEQQNAIRRSVAIKLVRHGFDGPEVLARFEAERQTLARLDHPGIARVFDAGVSSAGRSYFVMEFVPGSPVTAFADGLKLSVRDRLELFIQICQAVAHAHTRGVIHRDLKPGNVLAFTDDQGKPAVKVIDFGVAKALSTDGQSPSVTQLTAVGLVLGTYEYMSPEQASADPNVDTRSDVYSLGVLLYELLTGARPFERSTLTLAADEELRRVIREMEPPRPSQRLSIDGANATSVAMARSTHPVDLARSLRRELEWIPLKAIRKEPDRRYASATALAADVRNFLDGRPLEAAPESRRYLVGKFARRYRRSITIITVLLLLAVGAIVGYIRAVGKAQRATESALHDTQIARNLAESRRVTADQQRAEAESASNNASTMIELFFQSFSKADESTAAGHGALVADAIPAAIAVLDASTVKLKPDFECQLRITLARIMDNNSRFDVAIVQAGKGLDLARKAYGSDDNQTISDALFVRSGALTHAGRTREGYDDATDCLAMRRRLSITGEPIVEALAQQGACLLSMSRYADAAAPLELALKLDDALPNSTLRGAILSNLALSLRAANQLEAALARYREALVWSRRFRPKYTNDILSMENNIAELLRLSGKPSEALAQIDQATAEVRAIFGDDVRPVSAAILTTRAKCLAALGRDDEAANAFQTAFNMWQQLHPDGHPDTLHLLDGWIQFLRKSGNAEEALAKAHLKLDLDLKMPERKDSHFMSLDWAMIGLISMELKQYNGALAAFTEAIAVDQRAGNHDPLDAGSLAYHQAQCLVELNRTAEAEVPAAEAVKQLRLASDGKDSVYLVAALTKQSQGAAFANDTKIAGPAALEAVAMAGRILPADHPFRREAEDWLNQLKAANKK